jgi:hypothetical protein
MPSGVESIAESLPGGDTKLGGYSIYLYGFVIAGVVLVYLWWNARGTDPNADAIAAEDTLPNLSGDLGDLPKSTGDGNTATDDTTKTNFYWEQQALNWLATQGVPLTTAQAALEKYLNGETYTYEQGLIVNKAAAKFGAPPEALMSTPKGGSESPAVNFKNAKWGAFRKDLITVGNTQRYHTNMTPYAGTVKPGTKVAIVQKASVNGVAYGRTLSGVYYKMSDLTDPAPKAKARAK